MIHGDSSGTAPNMNRSSGHAGFRIVATGK